MCAPGEWVKTYLTRRGAFALEAKLWNSSAWIAKITVLDIEALALQSAIPQCFKGGTFRILWRVFSEEVKR